MRKFTFCPINTDEYIIQHSIINGANLDPRHADIKVFCITNKKLSFSRGLYVLLIIYKGQRRPEREVS